VAVSAVVLALAGCSTTTTGTPSAQGGGQPVVTEGQTNTPDGAPDESAKPGPGNNFGAPKVATPLDVTKWQANPCSTLTTAQQHALGLTKPGKVDHSDLGNICDWSPAFDITYALGFNIKFAPGGPAGLADAYEAAGPGGMRRLPDVHGQPAATEPSQNINGSCTIYLGASDQIEYAASVTIGDQEPQYKDPCAVAQKIADDATATMTDD
jgi:Protein of unknown function (DUF3558)